MKPLIAYSHQVTNDCLNELAIDENFGVTYSCEFSMCNMPVRQLGLHYISISKNDADLQNIYNVMSVNKLLEGPQRVDPPLVGALQKTFYIREKERHYTSIIDTRDVLPAPIRTFEEALFALIKRVNHSPVRSLSITGKIEPSVLFPGEEATINIHMTNRGTKKTQFANPAAFKKDSGESIKLNLFKTNSQNSGSQNLLFSHSINLAEKEFRIDSTTVLPSDKSLLTIQPGETINTAVTLRLPKCELGIYCVELIYISVGDMEGNKDIVYGEYHCDPVDIVVKSKKT